MSRNLLIPLLIALAAAMIAAACSSSDQPQPNEPPPSPQPQAQPAQPQPEPQQQQQTQPVQQQTQPVPQPEQPQSQPEPQAQPQQQQQTAQSQAPPSEPPGTPTLVTLTWINTDEINDLLAFEQDAYRFTLAENASGVEEPITLGTVAAVAAEGRSAGHFVGTDGFAIDTDSGLLTYTGPGVDYEAEAELVPLVAAAVAPFTVQLELSWRPPSDSGSAPVEDYEYRWRKDGGAWTTESSDSAVPILIEDANIVGTYEAQVRAISTDGASDWSRVSSIATVDVTAWVEASVLIEVTDELEPPGQVGGIRSSSAAPAHEAVNLWWSAPPSIGRPSITGFEYRYRWGGRAWSAGETIIARTLLSRLRAETTYELQIRALNDDGAGEWSEIVEFTTDLAPYEPVVQSNADWWNGQGVFYAAVRDPFTDDVRTDIRIRGRERDLLFDAVCFDNGGTAIGFRLLRLDHDDNFPEELEVTWRIDDGQIETHTLEIQVLGTTPALYLQAYPAGQKFLDIVKGNPDDQRLYVRIEYRGVQEDSFNLQTFRSSPVHDNLVRCGDY